MIIGRVLSQKITYQPMSPCLWMGTQAEHFSWQPTIALALVAGTQVEFLSGVVVQAT